MFLNEQGWFVGCLLLQLLGSWLESGVRLRRRASPSGAQYYRSSIGAFLWYSRTFHSKHYAVVVSRNDVER